MSKQTKEERASVVQRYWAENRIRLNAIQRAQYAANKQGRLAASKRWRDKNPDKAYAYSLKKYGLTPQDVDQMRLRQSGKCALCHQPLTSGYGACIDHCHTTGKARGLLCCGCNTDVRVFENRSHDWLVRALTYIEIGGCCG